MASPITTSQMPAQYSYTTPESDNSLTYLLEFQMFIYQLYPFIFIFPIYTIIYQVYNY